VARFSLIGGLNHSGLPSCGAQQQRSSHGSSWMSLRSTCQQAVVRLPDGCFPSDETFSATRPLSCCSFGIFSSLLASQGANGFCPSGFEDGVFGGLRMFDELLSRPLELPPTTCQAPQPYQLVLGDFVSGPGYLALPARPKPARAAHDLLHASPLNLNNSATAVLSEGKTYLYSCAWLLLRIA